MPCVLGLGTPCTVGWRSVTVLASCSGSQQWPVRNTPSLLPVSPSGPSLAVARRWKGSFLFRLNIENSLHRSLLPEVPSCPGSPCFIPSLLPRSRLGLTRARSPQCGCASGPGSTGFLAHSAPLSSSPECSHRCPPAVHPVPAWGREGRCSWGVGRGSRGHAGLRARVWGPRCMGMRSRTAPVLQVAGDLVRRLHLEGHVDKLVATYSGGTKRKLSTALALLGKPDLLLLVSS